MDNTKACGLLLKLLFSYYLDYKALLPLAIKFSIIDLLPGPKIELTLCNWKGDLVSCREVF